MDFREAFDPVRALGSAWRLILRAPLTLIAGGAFVVLTGGGPQNFSFSFEDQRLHWFGALAVGSIVLVACCFGLIRTNPREVGNQMLPSAARAPAG